MYEKGRESRWFIGDMSSSTAFTGNVTLGGRPIKEIKYDEMKLKAKSRTGEKYGEIFVAFEDEGEDAFLGL